MVGCYLQITCHVEIPTVQCYQKSSVYKCAHLIFHQSDRILRRVYPIEMGHRKSSRREFISKLLANGAAVQTGLWSSVIGAMTTTLGAEEADAQIFTHSFWKKKSASSYYMWGQNTKGQLGMGSITNVLAPTTVNISPVKMGYGGAHALALMADGKLYSMGSNAYGQLGINSTISKSTATQITAGPASWSQIAAGDGFSLGLDTNGYLWSFGNNADGELGIGNTISKSSPVQVSASTVWSKISAGVWHSAGITSTGALFTWGYNDSYQLGLTDQTTRKSPVQVQVGTSWSQVAAGYEYSVGITSAGTLMGWGNGDYNQGWDGTLNLLYTNMGDAGSSPTQILNTTGSFTQVRAGINHALALRTDGRLYAWGNAAFGQTGTLSKILASPNQLTGTFTLMPSCMQGYHMLLITGTANAKFAGTNLYGEVGSFTSGNWYQTLTNTAIGSSWQQIACGGMFSLGIDTVGKAWGFGFGGPGVLGNGSTGTVNASPVQVSSVGTNSWTQVTAGVFHAMGIQTDGSLWSWGYSGDGQLGDGTYQATIPSPVKIGAQSWAQIAAGGWHSIGIDSSGNMFGWGWNADGQIGNNATTGRSSPVQVTIAGPWKSAAAGWNHSIALKVDGTLWTSGSNYNGQLGDSTATFRKVFAQIGTDSWTQVTAGRYHSAGIKVDGTLWAWGDNTYGAIGHNQIPGMVSSPVQISGSWSQVVAGFDMFLGKKSDGTYWTWGGNRSGNLGIGINTFSPVQVAGSWTQIHAGNGFSAAVKTNGTLWVWGTNTQGELGLGDTAIRSSPVQIPGSWTLIPGDAVGPTTSFVAAKKIG